MRGIRMSDCFRVIDAVEALKRMDAEGTPITVATLKHAMGRDDVASSKAGGVIRKLVDQGYLVCVGEVRHCARSSCSVYATAERAQAGIPDDYLKRLEWKPSAGVRRPRVTQAIVFEVCRGIDADLGHITVPEISKRTGAHADNIYKMVHKLVAKGYLARVGYIPTGRNRIVVYTLTLKGREQQTFYRTSYIPRADTAQ